MCDPNALKDGDRVRYAGDPATYIIRLWKDGFAVREYQFWDEKTKEQRIWVFNDFSWANVERVK